MELSATSSLWSTQQTDTLMQPRQFCICLLSQQLLQLVRQTKIINLDPLAILAKKCQNRAYQKQIEFKAKCRFCSFCAQVCTELVAGPVLTFDDLRLVQSLISVLEGSPLFNGNGFLDSALDGVVQTITLAKPPGPFPLSGTWIKERQSHDISAAFEHCQATGHNINPHNVKVLPDENSTIKRRVKEAIAIKQRNPP